MKRPDTRYRHARTAIIALIICAVQVSCGLTALAAEEGSQDVPVTDNLPGIVETLPPGAADTTTTTKELYPSDVRTITEGGSMQIIRTYTLTPKQDPAGIPRGDFTRDGRRYTLTDITEKRNAGTDVRQHTETVEINTATNNPDEIIKALAQTLDYEAEDGYCGTLTPDLSTVKCEAAGYKTGKYTVSATREYPHLSENDLSLIPKTVTENGRTLTLDDVSWEAQNYTTVDYEQIPDSYRAVAKYTASASESVATGYITTVDYTGEIAKMITGDTVYTAYFTETPKPSSRGSGIPLAPILAALAVLAAGAGTCTFLFRRHNVKIYRDDFRLLAAKDKISRKKQDIDLSPLTGTCFGLEIDKFTAKALNGVMLKVIYGPEYLEHKIAFEGGVYKIETDFDAKTIRAIY